MDVAVCQEHLNLVCMIFSWLDFIPIAPVKDVQI